MYIFISHSSKDAEIAQELCNIIEDNGSQCFLAPRNIRSGFEYAAEIVNGIDNSDIMLLLLSKNAVTSPHILREIERAVSKSIPIIVYKLEEVELTKSYEYFLMSHQWLNAEYGTHTQLLNSINDIKNNSYTSIEAATEASVNGSAKASFTESFSDSSKAHSVASTNGTSNGDSNADYKKRKKIILYTGIAAAATLVVILSVILALTLTGKEKPDNNTGNNSVNNNTTSGNVSDNTSSDKPTETTSSQEAATQGSSSNTNVVSDIKLGDTVVFGRYNDADIYWKVIKISEDGTEAVLITKNIITFKAFDSANTGTYGEKDGVTYFSQYSEASTNMQLQADIRGNSSWQNSDIRAWLNSDKETVSYEGAGPIASAMSDYCNAYNLEEGFLYNFSDEELAAIKETTVTTNSNALFDEETVTTVDRVFILSMDELEWLDEAGVSRLAVPTEEAIANNESYYYKTYSLEVFHTEASTWWLREPVKDSASKCYQVGHGAQAGENIYESIACCDGYGIRPAITVDLTSDCIKISK